MNLTDEQRAHLESLERAVRQSHNNVLAKEGELAWARKHHQTFVDLLTEYQESVEMGQQELPLDQPSTS